MMKLHTRKMAGRAVRRLALAPSPALLGNASFVFGLHLQRGGVFRGTRGAGSQHESITGEGILPCGTTSSPNRWPDLEGRAAVPTS